MSVPLLPHREGDNDFQSHEGGDHPNGDGSHAHQSDHHSHRPHEHPHIATEEECLAALTRLPALLALGALTAAKVNAMRSTYLGILQHYRQKRNPENGAAVANDEMVDALSRSPELANLLEPILSQKQIAEIMKRATDGDHRPA